MGHGSSVLLPEGNLLRMTLVPPLARQQFLNTFLEVLGEERVQEGIYQGVTVSAEERYGSEESAE